MEDVGDCDPKTQDIWHSLKRIQAATYRTGFNFWDIFRDLEPYGKHVTAEHKFLSVLCGPLKHVIGLTDEEILNIAAFFRTNDGRVDYDQFCRTIHDSDPPELQEGKRPEIDDPYESKILSPLQEREVKILLTKMSSSIEKPYVLRPYFQEYQNIKKKSGHISHSGFFRILKFLGIELSESERELFLAKYGDSHNVKYASFLKDLVTIKEHLKTRGMLDGSGKLLPIYRKQYATAEGSMLPAPDIFLEPDESRIGLNTVRNDPKYPWKEIVLTAFAKLKQHVRNEKINLCSYFLKRDPRGTGRIPLLFFTQAIQWIKYSRRSLTDLYLSHHEKGLITELYIDPEESDKFLWYYFVKDVYEGLDMEEVADWPAHPLTTPPDMIIDRLPKIPHPPTEAGGLPEREFFEEFYKKVLDRNANLLSLLRAKDWKKEGALNIIDFSDAMKRYHFLFTEDDLRHFIKRYGLPNNKLDYEKIAADHPLRIEKKNTGYYGIQNFPQEETRHEIALEEERMQSNIVEVLAKIKRILICTRVKLEDELKKFDEDETGLMEWELFERVLESCGLSLTTIEKECLHQVFQKDDDPNMIEYTIFYPTVDEESTMPCLSRLPLHEAMQHEKEKIAKEPHEFVNFDDRIRISKAVKKLSKKISLGNYNTFKAFDGENSGLVDRPAFQHILFNLGVLHLLTLEEIDSVMKGFGYEIKNKLYIDYQDFLNALDIVFRTEKAALRL